MAEDKTSKPWEQLGNEPDDRYIAFQIFLDMGSHRSYPKAAKIIGKAKNTIYNWSKEYNWLERADAFDRTKYLEIRQFMKEKYGEEILKNHETNVALSKLSSKILSDLVLTFKYYDVNFNEELHWKKLRYTMMICKAIKEVKSMTNFFPEQSAFAKFSLDEEFQEFLMNDESSQSVPNRHKASQNEEEKTALEKSWFLRTEAAEEEYFAAKERNDYFPVARLNDEASQSVPNHPNSSQSIPNRPNKASQNVQEDRTPPNSRIISTEAELEEYIAAKERRANASAGFSNDGRSQRVPIRQRIVQSFQGDDDSHIESKSNIIAGAKRKGYYQQE